MTLLLASGLWLVRVVKSVYGSQLAQRRCHLGFVMMPPCNNIHINIIRASGVARGGPQEPCSTPPTFGECLFLQLIYVVTLF